MDVTIVSKKWGEVLITEEGRWTMKDVSTIYTGDGYIDFDSTYGEPATGHMTLHTDARHIVITTGRGNTDREIFLYSPKDSNDEENPNAVYIWDADDDQLNNWKDA